MAKKSKTQRAKASAARAQRKAQAREAEASAATGGAKEAAEAHVLQEGQHGIRRDEGGGQGPSSGKEA